MSIDSKLVNVSKILDKAEFYITNHGPGPVFGLVLKVVVTDGTVVEYSPDTWVEDPNDTFTLAIGTLYHGETYISRRPTSIYHICSR